jgi:endonuclease/exonuclease/phosphatase family metal-dependent hydrolase
MPHELIDSHGLYQPVHLGVRHKRMLEKARKHADRLLKVDTRNIGWHGNAILVKRHIGVLACTALDLPTLEPRGAVMAELLVNDAPLRVIGMHLDLSGLWRRRQLRAILEAVARRPQKMPTVLMGDTNEWRTAAGCLQELEPQFHMAPTGASFHARHPVAQLDRIIVDKALNIEAAGVHMSPVARRASDHLPIWARVSG